MPDYEQKCEAALHQFLETSSAQLGLRDPAASLLVDEITRLVMSGGKRLRPALCCTAFFGCGGGDAAIFKVGASLELLHTFALIHDDVMDLAAARRGSESTPLRLGEVTAILAGDLALVLSDQLFWTSGFDPALLTAASLHLYEAKLDALAGQHLDTSAAGEKDHAKVAKLKTASYTFVGPLLVGASLAAAAPSVIEGLRGFGLLAGEAFQLSNDLEGIESDTVIDRSTLARSTGTERTQQRMAELVAGAKKMLLEDSMRELSDQARMRLNEMVEKIERKLS